MKYITLIPRVSEKSYDFSMNRNVYIFEVPTDANKTEVKKAVEAQFSVSVEAVNITVAKGKRKMAYRKRQRPQEAFRSDVKKAYVTLKEGSKIELFVAPEENK